MQMVNLSLLCRDIMQKNGHTIRVVIEYLFLDELKSSLHIIIVGGFAGKYNFIAQVLIYLEYYNVTVGHRIG